MSLALASIPDDLRVPLAYVDFDPTRAVGGAGVQRYKIMIIGQRLATGQVAALTPTRIFSEDQGDAAFGLGSQLAEMLRAYKLADRGLEVWSIALDDDAEGVKAAGQVEFVVDEGGLTIGMLALYIEGRRIRMSTTADDTAATLATRLIALINANKNLPVTAAVVAGQPARVKLEAKHAGECGNDIDLRMNYRVEDRTPLNLTVNLTAMAGGAGNPDVTAALSVMGEDWYRGLVSPYTDAANVAALQSEMESRWGPLNMRDSTAWMAYRDTLGGTAAFGAAKNTQHFSVMGIGASPTSPWIWAAILAGLFNPSLQNDPAKPLHNMRIPGVLAPAPQDRWPLLSRNQLLWDGISTYKCDEAGNCYSETIITTYQTNALGAEDPSYLYVETTATLSYLRWSLKNRIEIRFPRSKLRADPEPGQNFPAGLDIVTPTMIRNELISLFGDWEELGLVENFQQFLSELLVEIDADNPCRVNVLLGPNLVNQFRIFAANIQFRL